MNKLQELEMEKQEIENLLENFEIDPDNEDIQREFDNILDMDGDVKICGIFYRISAVWKMIDPIAYECAIRDYIDTLDMNDYNQNLRDELAEIETDIFNCQK